MNEVKHLFFDLDNTILDFSYASHQAFKSLLKHFNKDDFDSYSVYNVGNASVWKAFELGEISAIELRTRRFELYLEAMGWKGNGHEWNKVYLEHVIKHTKYIDGAEKLLKNLAKEFKIHIVTNGLKEVQRPRIAIAQLDTVLSSITVSDEISVPKPQKAFFDIAIQNAGVPDRNSILMIGDSYGSDIKGGYQNGIKTCWFNQGKVKMDPQIHDYEIHRIRDLEAILRNGSVS